MRLLFEAILIPLAITSLGGAISMWVYWTYLRSSTKQEIEPPDTEMLIASYIDQTVIQLRSIFDKYEKLEGLEYWHVNHAIELCDTLISRYNFDDLIRCKGHLIEAKAKYDREPIKVSRSVPNARSKFVKIFGESNKL